MSPRQKGKLDVNQGAPSRNVRHWLAIKGGQDMTKKTETGLFSADPAHMGDMMTAILRAQARMMDSILKQNIETLDFVRQRFEKDRAVFRDLADSDDPASAMQVMQDFWTRSMRDYTDEAGKIGALAAAAAEEIAEGLTDEAKALAGGAPRRKG